MFLLKTNEIRCVFVISYLHVVDTHHLIKKKESAR